MPQYSTARVYTALTAFAHSMAPASCFSSAKVVHPDTSDYRSLLLGNVPLLDVRAPVEYLKGSFPSTTNLPILTDSEREAVGTCYKTEGSDAAVALGAQLVSGPTKASRVKAWTEYARAHPHGYLYCFRGGMRSHTAQRWLAEESGVRYPLVTGGAKAMRTFLLEELAVSTDASRTDFVSVRGATGTGKTRVLDALGPGRSLDLEGIARHRGSTFGRLPTSPEFPSQPSQIDFENEISILLARLLEAAGGEGPVRVYVEDESRRIGRLTIPQELFSRMSTCGTYVTVTGDMEGRLDVLVEDYILDLGRRYVALYGEDVGPGMHRERLLGDLGRIKKRIGGDRHMHLTKIMNSAFDEYEVTGGDTALHRVWGKTLLEEYYDPMYRHQDEQAGGRELFRGSRDDVTNWALEGGTGS
eukprot:CAMPEP_0194316658 /NCGR_PEP_ID=MMETSP0171-20130528/13452_1 /TAXON_ID=218684 /ORGANISM="Corethron pennatum, Strain L29A3" /LENGTH=413 /DNA_ID=CAMNT_0039072979 /DNA_START=129 /DNA_END=1370 /DNA_ORIENTATION=+